jgi:hypothetical protein
MKWFTILSQMLQGCYNQHLLPDEVYQNLMEKRCGPKYLEVGNNVNRWLHSSKIVIFQFRLKDFSQLLLKLLLQFLRKILIVHKHLYTVQRVCYVHTTCIHATSAYNVQCN